MEINEIAFNWNYCIYQNAVQNKIIPNQIKFNDIHLFIQLHNWASFHCMSFVQNISRQHDVIAYKLLTNEMALHRWLKYMYYPNEWKKKTTTLSCLRSTADTRQQQQLQPSRLNNNKIYRNAQIVLYIGWMSGTVRQFPYSYDIVTLLYFFFRSSVKVKPESLCNHPYGADEKKTHIYI